MFMMYCELQSSSHGHRLGVDQHCRGEGVQPHINILNVVETLLKILVRAQWWNWQRRKY